MGSQDQNIDGSSIENSNVQQSQAERDAISLQNSHDNKVIINNIVLRLFGKSEPPQLDWDWGMDLLKRKQLPEIRKRLTDTLGSDRTLMDVSIENQPHWVNRPLQADRILHDGQDCSALDANQMLIEIFRRDDIRGRLLILGTPGAGKTTGLLNLAQQLVEEAISNPNTVIPVIFELSNWRDESQSIELWLIEQLYFLYPRKANSKIYEQWLERQVLLPLLDGLDELGLERQKKCTEKLNEFAQHYPQLVVCCRFKEFATADIMLPNLRWAVCLQPLPDLQIKFYLNSLNRLDLWSEIQVNPSLQALMLKTEDGDPGLLRIPLFFKLIASVVTGINHTSIQQISNKEDLLNYHIDEQLSPEKRNADRNKEPKKEPKKSKWAYKETKLEPNNIKTRRYLIWLAENLQADNKIELLIEHIQPTWLGSDQARYWYRSIFGFIPALFFLVPWSFYLSFKTPPMLNSLIFSLTFSLIMVLIIGWAFGAARRRLTKIEPVENFKHATVKDIWKNLKLCIVYELIILFFYGLYYLAVKGNLSGFNYRQITDELLFLQLMGIFIIIIGMIVTLQQGLNERLRPNQGIWKSLQNAILLIIPFSIPAGVLFGINAENKIWITALLLALTSAFQVGGGIALLQHFSLRIVLWRKGLPWDLARFLKYCEERKLIQSVGGRYRFLHRELLDHFAPPKISESKEICDKP